MQLADILLSEGLVDEGELSAAYEEHERLAVVEVAARRNELDRLRRSRE